MTVPTLARALFAAVTLLALSAAPFACTSGGSRIGDPCMIGDEQQARFGGTFVTEQLAEDPSVQCGGQVCLANHFSGRVSCPLGQPARPTCEGPGDTTSCAGGAACVQGYVVNVSCGPKMPDACAGLGVCDEVSGTCACTEGSCPEGLLCDAQTKKCAGFVCHAPGDCQSADATDAENAGKGCCLPGTDQPVTEAVCGQCATRPAEEAVYCTCRCGEGAGIPKDPSRAYCECPSGFSCTELRDLGLGANFGMFCVKEGPEIDPASWCPSVRGFDEPPRCDPQ